MDSVGVYGLFRASLEVTGNVVRLYFVYADVLKECFAELLFTLKIGNIFFFHNKKTRKWLRAKGEQKKRFGDEDLAVVSLAICPAAYSEYFRISKTPRHTVNLQ